MNMYYTTNNGNPSAWIVDSRDRGRKKIYLNSKIYLENNQEFLIELFNPLQDSVLAEIKINGRNASANGLILKPGQRFYLDCFLDDKKKFLFKTYEVENSTEALNAVANNGFVEVSFFKEKITPRFTNTVYTYVNLNNPSTWTISNTNGVISNSISTGGYVFESQTPISLSNTSGTNINSLYTSNSTGNIGNLTTNSYYNTSSSYCNTSSLNLGDNLRFKTTKSLSDTVETGRIEKGDKSQQKFESVEMDFETYCINKVSYQLLPNSKKPVETTELKKNFCSDCGHKLKGTERFCPSCGTRI